MLGADVVMTELKGLAKRQLEDLLRTRSKRRRVAGRRSACRPDRLLDSFADGLERDAEGLERFGRESLAFVNEAQQDVLGADEAVVQQRASS